MKKESEKKEYITRVDLEEQTQVLLTALDKRFGQMELSLGKSLSQTEERLRIDINNVQTLIDGYVKAQEDFRQEFVIMKEELKQIKKIIKEKLGLEIKTA